MTVSLILAVLTSCNFVLDINVIEANIEPKTQLLRAKVIFKRNYLFS
ncbi:MAG: hypothetical protein C5S38_08970 [Candidatus Methanophagaceae archaeon]|nr:MAG: hypothetical protein C5S38_08970 [Methanophagales archaeon]